MKRLPKVKPLAEVVLTPEQEDEAKRLAQMISAKVQEEALGLARMLVAKDPAQMLGQTEFEVRQRVHQWGAFALQTALNERKKGGTWDRA
jgi:hypothetical protein